MRAAPRSAGGTSSFAATTGAALPTTLPSGTSASVYGKLLERVSRRQEEVGRERCLVNTVAKHDDGASRLQPLPNPGALWQCRDRVAVDDQHDVCLAGGGGEGPEILCGTAFERRCEPNSAWHVDPTEPAVEGKSCRCRGEAGASAGRVATGNDHWRLGRREFGDQPLDLPDFDVTGGGRVGDARRAVEPGGNTGPTVANAATLQLRSDCRGEHAFGLGPHRKPEVGVGRGPSAAGCCDDKTRRRPAAPSFGKSPREANRTPPVLEKVDAEAHHQIGSLYVVDRRPRYAEDGCSRTILDSLVDRAAPKRRCPRRVSNLAHELGVECITPCNDHGLAAREGRCQPLRGPGKSLLPTGGSKALLSPRLARRAEARRQQTISG